MIAIVVIGAVLLGGLALLMTIRDGGVAPVVGEPAYAGLPESGLRADDVEDLRLRTALRGYRMDEVDDVIGRLQAALREAEKHASAAATSSDGDAAA